MDSGEPPSPAPRPERAQSEAPSEHATETALADMTAEEALRVAAEEGIELETSDRLSVTGYVGVFLNHATATDASFVLLDVGQWFGSSMRWVVLAR